MPPPPDTPVDEARARKRRLLWTLLALAVAVGAPQLAGWIGVLLAFPVVILWYAFCGHPFTGRLVDRAVSALGGKAGDPAARFEPEALGLLDQGEPEEALRACERWIRHQNGSAAPRLLAARILVTHLRDPERAIRGLEHTLALPLDAAEVAEVALYLGELYRRAGRSTEASSLFRRVRARFPWSPEIRRLPEA
jgi:tetratricopeptide (TPR) repeat protein